MSKERYHEIIDEVYQEYDELFDSYHPPFSAPYPKRLTKEELVEEIKKGGHDELGVKITERELSLSERYDIMKNGDLNEWLTVHYKEPKTMEYMDKHNIPKQAISLTYNNETITVYV